MVLTQIGRTVVKGVLQGGWEVAFAYYTGRLAGGCEVAVLELRSLVLGRRIREELMPLSARYTASDHVHTR